MIAHLRGRLLEKHPNRVIVDVQGVGYEALVPLSTFYEMPEPGGEISLRIHTHVREDALLLYGFATLLELQLFERLISVSQIGPKLALAVLSGIEPKDLITAVKVNDVARLTAIPGVGEENGGAHRARAERQDGRVPSVRRRGLRAGRLGRGVAAHRRALGADQPGVSSAARRKGRRYH